MNTTLDRIGPPPSLGSPLKTDAAWEAGKYWIVAGAVSVIERIGESGGGVEPGGGRTTNAASSLAAGHPDIDMRVVVRPSVSPGAAFDRGN
mmetsp:Transcript_9949/g.25284  ORF Transcript_9949/g.25284 Transcript_9949/m.25284 type:complete len:91 (+) Transcript_9949:264-536(+)